MGELNGELTDWDYPWLETLSEAIGEGIEHLQLADQCQNGLTLKYHLAMAAKAMTCALQLYKMRVEREKIE